MISVVTPTFCRPSEIAGLLDNLARQDLLPSELIVVDGSPADDQRTETLLGKNQQILPFGLNYFRHDRGTAIQRNAGIEKAQGDFVAFIDDDVRLEPGFFKSIIDAFEKDTDHQVGGIVGYRINQHFDLSMAQRWRWYRRLRMLTTFEPGRYDFQTGYPINANMQPPFSGVRDVDFMTTACAVWRREVFESGLRFDPFFRDYGVLEDAHFALRAGRTWKLLQCGDAHCRELNSAAGRIDRRRLGYKCVVNYYYVFSSVAGPLTRRQKVRFWKYQAFELFRVATSAVRRHRFNEVNEVFGRLEGALSVVRGTAFTRTA